jgi:hypothetical protein
MTDLPHLRLEKAPQPVEYISPQGGGGEFLLPPRDRSLHARKLKTELEQAQAQAEEIRRQQDLSGILKREEEGIILTFRSDPGHDLKLESLELRRYGIELLSVASDDNNAMIAKVFVPEGQLMQFLRRIDLYATVQTSKGTYRNKALVESIASIRLAVVEDFWEDLLPFPGPDEAIWWEVWLRGGRNNAELTHQRFSEWAHAVGLRVSREHVTFPERIVVLAFGTQRQLSQSLDLLTLIAELRRAKEVATAYVELPPREQREFVDDMVQRLIPPPVDAPAVCLLDTGVNRLHPLLAPALAEQDAQAINPDWGAADHHREQHGTGMAGVALYGHLADVMSGTDAVPLRHRLESVKILPPPPNHNEPGVYGWVTQEAAARAQVSAPRRNRVHCMAVTADDRDQGLPSSWSGAVDELCAGVLDETPKLMFITAGNVRGELHEPSYRYPDWNFERAGIEDPGQSWNALTVGAFTEKVFIQHPDFRGWQPVAESGDLCPTSRTSLAWSDEHHAGWPLKPDLVMEGGNYAESGTQRAGLDDLSLLTTILHPTGRLLETTRDTSPATAAAARVAAIIWSQYPRLWPETVRGLMVHSARWTPAMIRRFPGDRRSVVQRRLRCYGYGVPDLRRALYSAENAATLLYEGELQPYCRIGSDIKTCEMHLHELPWPKQVLEELGDVEVTMRVTLSYFVEPSPGRVGWGKNHRYQSHGLRFDVIRPLEGEEEFKRRLSRAEWEDSRVRPESVGETRNWVVGEQGRTHGALHSDWWEGTAADLAQCNRVAVYPVTGWWRERPHLGRVERKARYSLLITIETPRMDVNLYAAIATAAEIGTELVEVGAIPGP